MASPTQPALTNEELDIRFTYHAPHGDQVERFVAMRDAAKDVALLIRDISPVSREQSCALTALDEVVFWTNAAIARREPEDD
jgi:hypothetical protein